MASCLLAVTCHFCVTRRVHQAHCLSTGNWAVTLPHACAESDSVAGDLLLASPLAGLTAMQGPPLSTREQLAALMRGTSLGLAVLQRTHLLEVSNDWVVEAALVHDLPLHVGLVVPDAVTWLQPTSRCQWCCLWVQSNASIVLLLDERQQWSTVVLCARPG